MQTSKYESVAKSFLAAYPVDTVLTSNSLQTWVTDHPDGAAIKPDLAIEDPAKRLNALRRHLNDGGRSDALPEAQRFVIQIEDAKRKTYKVRAHHVVAREQANAAIGKTVLGSANTFKRAKNGVNAVKLDELSEGEREAIVAAHENVVKMETAVMPVLAQQVDQIWVTEMARRGISAEHARKIREALPAITAFQKLLRAITPN